MQTSFKIIQCMDTEKYSTQYDSKQDKLPDIFVAYNIEGIVYTITQFVDSTLNVEQDNSQNHKLHYMLPRHNQVQMYNITYTNSAQSTQDKSQYIFTAKNIINKIAAIITSMKLEKSTSIHEQNIDEKRDNMIPEIYKKRDNMIRELYIKITDSKNQAKPHDNLQDKSLYILMCHNLTNIQLATITRYIININDQARSQYISQIKLYIKQMQWYANKKWGENISQIDIAIYRGFDTFLASKTRMDNHLFQLQLNAQEYQDIYNFCNKEIAQYRPFDQQIAYIILTPYSDEMWHQLCKNTKD